MLAVVFRERREDERQIYRDRNRIVSGGSLHGVGDWPVGFCARPNQVAADFEQTVPLVDGIHVGPQCRASRLGLLSCRQRLLRHPNRWDVDALRFPPARF